MAAPGRDKRRGGRENVDADADGAARHPLPSSRRPKPAHCDAARSCAYVCVFIYTTEMAQLCVTYPHHHKLRPLLRVRGKPGRTARSAEAAYLNDRFSDHPQKSARNAFLYSHFPSPTILSLPIRVPLARCAVPLFRGEAAQVDITSPSHTYLPLPSSARAHTHTLYCTPSFSLSSPLAFLPDSARSLHLVACVPGDQR